MPKAIPHLNHAPVMVHINTAMHYLRLICT
jgi:hypothetical protein